MIKPGSVTRLERIEAARAPQARRGIRVPTFYPDEQAVWMREAIEAGHATPSDLFICRVLIDPPAHREGRAP
jgi:hypothetical protein